VTKIKVKKKAADWAVFSFLKAAQIWSTRPIWQHCLPISAKIKAPSTFRSVSIVILLLFCKIK